MLCEDGLAVASESLSVCLTDAWLPLRTAIMLACESRHLAAIHILVQRGADLRAADSLGHDVYHYAKLSGSAEVRNVLNAALERKEADQGTTRCCTTQGNFWKSEVLLLNFTTVLNDIGLYHM